MPVMEHQPTRDARIRTIRRSYDELSQLLAKLSPPSLRSLSQHKLQALSIKTAAMALRPEGNHDAHPLFCKLVSPDMMDEAFDTTFTSENSIDWPGYEPLESSGFYPAYSIGRTLLHYTLSGQDVQEPLVDTEWYATGLVLAFVFRNQTSTYRSRRDSSEALTLHRNVYPNTPDHPYGHYQWGICQILRVDNTSRPHLACLHIDDAPADEGLRPSELISAIKLMMQAMRLDRRAQFRVNPVRNCFSVLPF